jgi:SOS-response transcriptional repressor LexA
VDYSTVLARLRKENGLTQIEVADYISQRSEKPYSFKMVSHWEHGTSAPPLEQFLLLCELYGIEDIQGTFRGLRLDYRGAARLNALGRSRAEEYIGMLAGNPMFAEEVEEQAPEYKPAALSRCIRLYDVPVAAGAGVFLDSDSYEDFEVDDTVPGDADYAVKVSGDSMMPRFVDSQIIFVHEQETLEVGEIGIFAYNGDAYVKQMGHGELVSLNTRYKPISVREYDSFRIFGKVVG